MPRSSDDLVRLYRMIDKARPPQRADRSAAGTLPTRAYRYCEAVTSATAFGWWAFPPTDLLLFWDGIDIFWQYEGVSDWLPLMPSAQFPGFAAQFNSAAPPDLHDCSPPFLTALPEPACCRFGLDLWPERLPVGICFFGLLPIFRRPGGFSLYEGIVATDRWFGPLFTNLRLTRTNAPVQTARRLSVPASPTSATNRLFGRNLVIHGICRLICTTCRIATGQTTAQPSLFQTMIRIE